VVGFTGAIEFDWFKPDGTPRKLMDSSKIVNLGRRPRISLSDGLADAYAAFMAAEAQGSKREVL